MNKILLLITFCFLFTFHSRAQGFSWATVDMQNQKSAGVAIEKDPFNNLFVAETYTNAGQRPCIALQKIDSSHNVVWSQKIEGKNFSQYPYYSVSTDQLGDVYLTATLLDSIFLNNTFYLGGPEMFLVKYNSQGVFQWLRKTSGGGVGMKVTTDSQNNVYVAGNIYQSVNFDSINLNPGGLYNYIAKYNSSGKIQWVKQTKGGGASTWGIGLKTDSNDNLYLSGTFYANIKFDNISISAYGGSTGEDIYLAKINPSGQWLWATNAGGNGQDIHYALDIDPTGLPYITGFFSSPTISFGSIILSNGGGDDYFIAKYNGSGNPMWAQGGGGSGTQWGTNICIDNNNLSYVARNSVFFSNHDSLGNYLNSQFIQANNKAMVRDNKGCIYITGDFIGPLSLGPYNFNSGSNSKIFIAKFCNSLSTAVKKNDLNEESLSIYPNPTLGTINIVFSDRSLEIGNIQIKDAVGRLIYSEMYREFNTRRTIDLNMHSQGVYFIQFISSNGKSIVKKIVVH